MAPTTPMTLAQIVKRVEKRSLVSSTDVKAVLDALQYEVIDALQNGNTVRLGDLGSFRLSIKATGFDTSAEAKKAGGGRDKDGERAVHQECGDEGGTFALQCGARFAG